MLNIELSDQLYQQARRRATETGFRSVDEYVAQVVASDVSDDLLSDEHIFTPEVVTELKQIDAEIKAGGKTYTEAELDEHFRRRSQAWRAAQGN